MNSFRKIEMFLTKKANRSTPAAKSSKTADSYALYMTKP